MLKNEEEKEPKIRLQGHDKRGPRPKIYEGVSAFIHEEGWKINRDE